VIYLDFAKAFDKVDHKILMNKIRKLGIGGKIYRWLDVFLSNRKQQVVIEGISSGPEDVVSGVPQGTVLGPLLFIIYIDDIINVINHSKIIIFADDSKITASIKSPDDHINLETDLKAVINWAKNNNMQLHYGKFQLLQHGKNKELKSEYKIDEENTLKSSTEVRDLGVQVEDTLSWDAQITKMVNSARRFGGWILRCFKSRRSDIILQLIKSFIIPKLEYCSPLWSPYKIKDIIKLESVLRTMTSKINEMNGMDYHERLKSLKLFSMQRRRERFMIIMVWKIENQLIPNTLNLEFYDNKRLGIQCRRKLPKLKSGHLYTQTFNFFPSSGPALYNIIPKKIKESTTLELFKARLDNLLLLIPDTPPTPGYATVHDNSLVNWIPGRFRDTDITAVTGGPSSHESSS
jgi:hypothetical protein